jgi:hypothetical protein
MSLRRSGVSCLTRNRTTNFAESYNCVLRGARPLPLVGIIELFMYHTMLYFHTRSQIAGEVIVVWTSLGPLPRWVPGPTTRWAPGTTRLVSHGT